MRAQLHQLLKAGHSPLRLYVNDIKKYFYLGELLALVDLSLVCMPLGPAHFPHGYACLRLQLRGLGWHVHRRR